MQAQKKVRQTTNREALWIGENKTNAFYFHWKVTTSALHKIPDTEQYAFSCWRRYTCE